MGSFMAQRFCQLYGSELAQQCQQKIAGLVLSGSNYMPRTACKIIAGVARLERARLGAAKSVTFWSNYHLVHLIVLSLPLAPKKIGYPKTTK